MQISHVIRGDEWISSTPKHLLLYESFGWGPPTFVHIPPILGESKKKLSKREGAKSVLEYIDEGYLPQALVNFLALLGWSPKGDRELFTLNELVAEFSLDRLNKNSPIFNIEKLNWFNKKYIQKLTTEELAEKLKNIKSGNTPGVSQAASSYTPGVSKDKLTKIINLVRDRMTTLADFDNVTQLVVENDTLFINSETPTKPKWWRLPLK